MKIKYAILGSALFLVVVPGTFAGVIPWLISGWRFQAPLMAMPALRVVGGLMILAGAPALLDSFARFALLGRGTPAPPLPPDRLVVSGLYRVVRNPMYVSVLLLIFGQALMFGDGRLLIYGAIVAVAFHLFIVFYEEPSLVRRFGSPYERYRAHVRRWLPQLPPWREDGKP